jgi:hypothetical protein
MHRSHRELGVPMSCTAIYRGVQLPVQGNCLSVTLLFMLGTKGVQYTHVQTGLDGQFEHFRLHCAGMDIQPGDGHGEPEAPGTGTPRIEEKHLLPPFQAWFV